MSQAQPPDLSAARCQCISSAADKTRAVPLQCRNQAQPGTRFCGIHKDAKCKMLYSELLRVRAGVPITPIVRKPSVTEGRKNGERGNGNGNGNGEEDPLVTWQRDRLGPLPPYDQVARFGWQEGRYQGQRDGKPFTWILPNNQRFAQFIAREFADYRITTNAQTVEGTEILPHQRFVRDYMGRDTPYRGVLLYWGLGSGKTRGAVEIAFPLWQAGWRVVVMTPGSLRDNFSQEWEKWGRLHGETFPPSANLRDPAVQRRLRFYLVTYNYLSVVERLEALYQTGEETPPTVLIIDEVHDLISRLTKSYNKSAKNLYRILMGLRNTKIVALSGSPLINSPYELGLLFNILRGPICMDPNCAQQVEYNVLHSGNSLFPYDPELFDGLYIDYQAAQVRSEESRDLFRVRIQGLVSNYRGLPSKEVYPDLIGPDVEEVALSQTQFTAYVPYRLEEKAREVPIDKGEGVSAGVSASEAVTQRNQGNTFKVRTRQVSNFTYPPDVTRPTAHTPVVASAARNAKVGVPKAVARRVPIQNGTKSDDESNSNLTSSNGVAFSELTFDQVDEVLGDEIPPREEVDDTHIIRVQMLNYAQAIDGLLRQLRGRHDIFSVKGLAEYAPKYLRALEIIERGEKMERNGANATVMEKTILQRYETVGADGQPLLVERRVPGGLVFFYSNFRHLEGLDLFAKTLEYYGYQAASVGPHTRLEDLTSGQLRYAIVSGEEDQEIRTAIINLFNDPRNRYGQYIKLLMGTSAAAQGISLHNVRQVILLEPHWNRVRLDQAIGRARRVNSHRHLPPMEQNVHAYELRTVFSPEMTAAALARLRENVTTDQTIARLAKVKDDIGRSFLRLVKESAVDCRLNRRHNEIVEPGEGVVCVDFGNTDQLAYGADYRSKTVTLHRTQVQCVPFPPNPQKIPEDTPRLPPHWRSVFFEGKHPRYGVEVAEVGRPPEYYQVRVRVPRRGTSGAGGEILMKGLPLYPVHTGRSQIEKWLVTDPATGNSLPELYDPEEVVVISRQQPSKRAPC